MGAVHRKIATILGIVLCFCGPVVASFAAGPPQTVDHGRLLVLSKRDRTLAVIDPATLQVLFRVPVGADPHEVTTDGSIAWVSNYGFGAFHTLAVVDLRTQKALAPIDLGALSGPHGLTFVAGHTWFTAEGAKALGRYDPALHRIDLILGTGQNRTHMIWVSPDAEHLVTTNVSSGTVSLFDREAVRMPPPPPGAFPGTPLGTPPESSGASSSPRPPGPPRPRVDWNQTIVKVGNGSEGFDVSPDLQEIWVANAQDGTISVIDRRSRSVVATLIVEVAGANRLKFTPDGRRVLVSTLAGGGLTVLDAHSREVLTRVPVGHGAAGILIEPNGARAFVACGPDNYIAVVDLQTLKVLGHIDAGGEPDGLAWAAH